MAKRGAPKGNTNAAKGKTWSDAIRKAIVQRKDMDKLATKLLDMALDGNMQALREIGDRLEGRPAQSVTNADGEAFVIQVKR